MLQSRSMQQLRLSAFSPPALGAASGLTAGATAALSLRVRVTSLLATLAHGSSTLSSLFPGAQPSVRKSFGRAFCRFSSAEPFTRSPSYSLYFFWAYGQAAAPALFSPEVFSKLLSCLQPLKLCW